MQLAAQALPPYHCFGDSTWSATIAGNGQSVLSGVLAGFVFAGIVAVLGVRGTDPGKEAARALKLMLCAFIGLAVAAYLFADQAADGNCLRASSEETLAGGILGTFAIIMIVSLTWLVAAYGMHKDGVLRFLRRLLYVAMAFVALLLCTSSYSYLQADTVHGPPRAVVIWLYISGGLLYVLGHPVTLQFAKFLLALIRYRRQSDHHRRGQEADRDRGKRIAVSLCAWGALLYLAAAAISDAFVLSTNDSAWKHPPSEAIYVVAWASLVVPLAVLILAMHALAPERPSDNTEHKSDAVPANRNTLARAGGMYEARADGLFDNLARLAMAWAAAYGLILVVRRWRGLRRPER